MQELTRRRILFAIVMLSLGAAAAYGQAGVLQILPSGVVGQPYSLNLYSSGGAGPPYTGYVLTGTLPPGLSTSSDPNGITTISGIPTTAVGSPFNFSYTFIDANNNSAGPFPFQIAIAGPSGPASLNVAPGGQPGMPAGLLSFTALAHSSTSMQQGLLVTNPGGGSLPFTASVASSVPWIASVSPTSGTVSASIPQVVTVTVDPSSLSAGSYLNAIHIASSAGNVDVPVSLFVTNTGPIVGVGLSGIRFNMVQGAGSGVTQTVNITDDGDPTSAVNWTASTTTIPGVPNGNFLTFGQQNGQSTPGNPVGLSFSLSPNASSLPAGAYYQLVAVADPNAQNSPQYITAVLNVVPSSSEVPPEPAPGGMVFSGRPGQQLGSQQLTLYLSSSTLVPFTAAASTPPGQTWLHVNPASSSASSSNPAVVTATVTTTGLAAGIYNGAINLQVLGWSAPFSEHVTLIIGSPVSLGASTTRSSVSPAVHRDAGVSGCTPSQLVLTETGIPGGFFMPAGWPTNLVATLNDDCGNAIGGASVSASFSNGDAPLSLADQGQGGQYAATWQPSNVSNATVTLNASDGNLKPALSQLSGSIYQNPAPILKPDGIVNNLNSLTGGALAPGTVAQVHGSGLAASAISPGVVPLPTTFQSTQLVIGGHLAPLYYVSDSQLNVQIPYELSAQQQVSAVGVVNGQLTLPVSVGLVPITPGIAALADGTLIAQHSADYSLVTSSSPAHAGETLIMYLVGMGQTNPKVSSGAASPGANPGEVAATVTVQPTVMVDGQKANVPFAGLTPGGVGLYQIDFTVPSTARAGTLSVTVSQGTVSANPTTLPVVTP